MYMPPIRRSSRPGSTGRLDLAAAARDPRPVVTRALSQSARPATDIPNEVRPGMPVAALERVLIDILPPYQSTGRIVPTMPHPTTLPLSRAFAPGERAGTLRPLYPEQWTPEFLRSVRQRDGHKCTNCGIATGDMYVHTPWNREKHAADALCVMVHGAMAVAHPDSDPSNLVGVRSLCGVCHNAHDRVHTRSQKALSLSWTGQLTDEKLDHLVSQIITPALQEAARPLGALQPGGADLLVALLADRDLNLTCFPAVDLFPALANESNSDINRVIAAGIHRLRVRGLMDSNYQLTRMLTVPAPSDGSHPAPGFHPRPARRHAHIHAAAPSAHNPRPHLPAAARA